MGRMKPAKHSVAVVVRAGGGRFLAVRRPDDPEDPLAGLWGLPAITLRDGEDEQAAVVRAGRAKLGVELAAGPKIGEQTADQGGTCSACPTTRRPSSAGRRRYPSPMTR